MNVFSKVGSHFNLADRGGLGSVSSVAADGHVSILLCPTERPTPSEPENLPPPRPTVRSTVTAVYVFLNYVGVAMGVGAKYFIEYSRGRMQFSWTIMVSSIILSAVIYPFVYKRICDPRRSGGVQYFISFQHGFFFQTLLEEIQRTAF